MKKLLYTLLLLTSLISNAEQKRYRLHYLQPNKTSTLVKGHSYDHLILKYHYSGCFHNEKYEVKVFRKEGSLYSKVGDKQIKLDTPKIKQINNNINWYRAFDKLGGSTSHSKLEIEWYEKETLVDKESYSNSYPDIPKEIGHAIKQILNK